MESSLAVSEMLLLVFGATTDKWFLKSLFLSSFLSNRIPIAK